MQTVDELVFDVYQKMSKAKDSAILESLSAYINRGLILVEEKQPVLVNDPSGGAYNLKCYQEVRLVLKDKEYIEKLEAENKELRECVNDLAASVANIQVLKSKYRELK